MKHRLAALSTVVAVASLVSAAPVSAAPITRDARLSGDGIEGGDPDATGRAVLRITPADGKICFRITYRRMVAPTFGSIRGGSMRRGDGPLEFTLFNGDRGGRASPIEGCSSDPQGGNLRRFKRHPERFYVQIDQHNYENAVLVGRLQRP